MNIGFRPIILSVDTVDLPPARPEPSRLKTLFWPDLTDEIEIHDAARHGYYACLFICGSTLFVVLTGGVALAALVDIFFFLMAGFGIRQLSRLASVAGFVMFLVEKAAMLAAGQAGFFSFVGILIAAILLNAVRAAYAARELRPAGDVDQIANPPFVASNAFAGWLETLPWMLWPKLRTAFKFYLAGLIALMIIGVVVNQLGVLRQQ
jgi:hypothetical protein